MYTARSCLLLVTLTIRTDSKVLDAVQKDSCNLGVPQQSALWVSMQQRIPAIEVLFAAMPHRPPLADETFGERTFARGDGEPSRGYVRGGMFLREHSRGNVREGTFARGDLQGHRSSVLQGWIVSIATAVLPKSQSMAALLTGMCSYYSNNCSPFDITHTRQYGTVFVWVLYWLCKS